MIDGNILSTVGVGLVTYFVLMLFEESFGITKMIRLVLALGIALLYYYYGHTIMPFIRTIFSYIGL